MTTKLLANQFKAVQNDPVEGFTVELCDDSSLYEWKVYLEGPKDTFYEKGIFQLSLKFPTDYPMSPPTLKFVSDFWHPNVYPDGKVCMSILHPPGEDSMSGELPEERWLPTQSVTTIILSLLSLLGDPNTSSPANVDASVEWRKNQESYKKKCLQNVAKANKEVPAHVKIPHPDTNAEEHQKVVRKWKEMNQDLGADDFYEGENDYSGEDDQSGSDVEEVEEGDVESGEESSSSDNKPSKPSTSDVSAPQVATVSTAAAAEKSVNPSPPPATTTRQSTSNPPITNGPSEVSAVVPAPAPVQPVLVPVAQPPPPVVPAPAPAPALAIVPAAAPAPSVAVSNVEAGSSSNSGSSSKKGKDKKKKKEKSGDKQKNCILM